MQIKFVRQETTKKTKQGNTILNVNISSRWDFGCLETIHLMFLYTLYGQTFVET